MKKKTKFNLAVIALTAFALLAGCSGKKEEQENKTDEAVHASGSTTADEAAAPQFQVDQKFQEQMASLFSSYVKLKDAFVVSDAVQVKQEAVQAKGALGKVDMTLLSGAAHNDWMTYISPIETSLNEIESATDIEVQRKAFSTLSDNLYKSVKAFGLGGQEAFYEYCPMAFNNEGGYWLSDKPQIRNPYFGDKMLTCGEVKEKLK